MRVRQFELRLIAVALTALWAIGALIVLVAYRPGGPVDVFVGLAASLPLIVSVAAIVWPPVVRTTGSMAGVVWLGAGAILLLVPAITGVMVQVLDRSSEPLLPSLEIVYPWALALIATGLFAGLGISRQVLHETALNGRRVAASAAFAAVTTLVIGGVFAGVSLADELALRDRPAAHSPFGPTSLVADPPQCYGTLQPASTARVEMDIGVEVDQRSGGDIRLSGARSGADVLYRAFVARPDHPGDFGAWRLGDRAEILSPGTGWTPVPPDSVARETLDANAFATALTPGNRETAEDRGLEFVEGARARRCRIALDGPGFVAAFPQVRWLVGDTTLKIWRGQLDYWVFVDGEVGKIVASVNGDAAAISEHGLLGTIQLSMTATDRDETVQIPAEPR